MTHLHWPFLELAVAIPALGALWVARAPHPDAARRRSLAASALALAAAVGAWLDLAAIHAFAATDRWDPLAQWLGVELLAIDELSAPLLPLAALQFFLTELATLRTKVRRFSFALTLVAEAIVLATLACRNPWCVCALLVAGAIPPWIELRRRQRSTRVFALHMGLMTVLLTLGQVLVASGAPGGFVAACGSCLLAVAVLLRSGVAPLHCWMTDLFDKASFGTALLMVTPMTGAYAAMRLVWPQAPNWVLGLLAVWSLATAAYASGMALVQRDPRRFFCYLFLSHASLVLVGVEIATPIGMTGALCVWLSVGMGMLGFGLTLRAVESRSGKLGLDVYHGLYEAMPSLAGFFLLTGLASVGFPGTIGFIAVELLVEGAIEAYPAVGAVVVLTAALNGIAVIHAYFRLFTGRQHLGTIDLRVRPAERQAILALSLLIIGGGLYPQPGAESRHHAAEALWRARQASTSAPEGAASASAASHKFLEVLQERF
jgi:NADH-quinone oxidoreductase subunit M